MMKRLTCTLAALALVMVTSIPAPAEFKGTLQRDQSWFLEINSQSVDTTIATVYYLGRDLEVIEIVKVPAATTVQQTIPKPAKGVRYAIVEVDLPVNGQAGVRVIQVATNFDEHITWSHPGDSFRFVFDFE
jgi:hypothetical protein